MAELNILFWTNLNGKRNDFLVNQVQQILSNNIYLKNISHLKNNYIYIQQDIPKIIPKITHQHTF